MKTYILFNKGHEGVINRDACGNWDRETGYILMDEDRCEYPVICSYEKADDDVNYNCSLPGGLLFTGDSVNALCHDINTSEMAKVIDPFDLRG